MSWRARARRFFKLLKFVFFAGVLCAAGYWAHKFYKSGALERAISPTADTLKKIEFKTDGAITQKWLGKNGFFPERKNLAEIDVVALRRKLENVPQIKSAEVSKIYPDTIRISVSEYKPAAKVAVRQDSKFYTYALSREGRFFEPVCGLEAELNGLPWVVGVPLVRSRGGDFEPYAYAEKIYELAVCAKKRLPAHYKTWRVLNAAELGSITLPIMLVLTSDGIKIVFHSNDIEGQIDKLEYILKYYEREDLSQIEKIDLSLPSKAENERQQFDIRA